MKYRNFGKTGHKISEICFGGAAISGEGKGYGFGAISENEAISLLHEAYDKGINTFDSAPIYGFGLSEERIGKAFKKNRNDVFLISKCGIDWHENRRVNLDNSPKTTQKMLQQSLKRLQSDYIDLYMVHWPDPRVDIRKTLEVLFKAQQEEKILHIGLCNTNQEEINLAQEVCEIAVYQSEYSLTVQKAETELFPFIADAAFMSWGTLDKGILTGSVTRDRKYEDDDCRKSAPWWSHKEVMAKLDKVDKLKSYLERKDYELIHCALGFNLMNPQLSTALCGFKNSKQLNSLLSAYQSLPSDDDLQEIKEIFL